MRSGIELKLNYRFAPSPSTFRPTQISIFAEHDWLKASFPINMEYFTYNSVKRALQRSMPQQVRQLTNFVSM